MHRVFLARRARKVAGCMRSNHPKRAPAHAAPSCTQNVRALTAKGLDYKTEAAKAKAAAAKAKAAKAAAN